MQYDIKIFSIKQICILWHDTDFLCFKFSHLIILYSLISIITTLISSLQNYFQMFNIYQYCYIYLLAKLTQLLFFYFACKKSSLHDTKYIKHTFNMMNQGYNVLYKWLWSAFAGLRQLNVVKDGSEFLLLLDRMNKRTSK